MADPVSTLAATLGQFSQNVQQLSAHLRQMGDGAANAVNGFYSEAKRYMRAFDEQRGLRYRPAMITLSTEIDGAGTAASGSNDFRVAQNEDFLVQSIRGFVALNALATEPGGGAFANPLTTTLTPSEIIKAKANNCRFTLLNKDTKVPITENNNPVLSSICPEAGGDVMIFQPNVVPGFIIPHNMTIQAQFTLQSANLVFNTASTTYGIILAGLYLSREVR